jgi:ParB/RepB/Spo0J family partition protein
MAITLKGPHMAKATARKIITEAPEALAAPAIQLLPLAHLKLHPNNTRKAGTRNDIEALAASIEGHGLINNLVGVPDPVDGMKTVWIIAGGRRLAALQLLARQQRWPADRPVPVLIRANDGLTLEASVAENVQRQALSPAAEARAFARLLDEEECDEAGVAQRFGITVRHVRQRLRLADLSPAVLKALDEGRITLDVAQAFASVPDQLAQARVLKDASQWALNNADAIRRELRTQADAMAGSNTKALIVGRDAFERAGGEVIEDLFSNTGALWRPASLVQQLFDQRELEAAADLARQHGFAGMVPDEWPPGDYESYTLDAALQLPGEDRAAAYFKLTISADDEGKPAFAIARVYRFAADLPALHASDTPEPAESAAPEAPPAKGLPASLDGALAMRRRDALAWAIASSTGRVGVKLATFLLIEQGPGGTNDYPGSSIHARQLDNPFSDADWKDDVLTMSLNDALAGGDAPLPVEWRQLDSQGARFAAFCELPDEDVLRWLDVAVARTLKSGSRLDRLPSWPGPARRWTWPACGGRMPTRSSAWARPAAWPCWPIAASPTPAAGPSGNWPIWPAPAPLWRTATAASWAGRPAWPSPNNSPPPAAPGCPRAWSLATRNRCSHERSSVHRLQALCGEVLILRRWRCKSSLPALGFHCRSRHGAARSAGVCSRSSGTPESRIFVQP